MLRPGVVPITRITKIYDLVRGFDCVNKAGICELVTRNAAIAAIKGGGSPSPCKAAGCNKRGKK
jgi:hypothetical protein